MQKEIVFLLLISLLASCTSILYQSPQPVNKKALEQFPKKYRGIYAFEDDDSPGMMIVGKRIFHLNAESNSIGDETYYLSDSLVIKKGMGYLFLNFLDKDDLWELYVVKRMKGGQLILLDEVSSDEKTIKTIQGITPLKTIRNENEDVDYYLLNPSKKELKTLLKLGIFEPLEEEGTIFIKIE